ncbi:DUF6103 family protein [uncultured Ruminococcus sp.]|uniref:DUF6103 family protein n=1 Tax=uncultured Ruminococcus sp. TaxID=165186 RepID=UPI00260380D3|nr:DUF6103 family protein [uncultured Ruminococcus sp.]
MKDKIILSMSDKKISALEMYLTQRNTTLNAEIDKYAEQLYSKTVLKNVREYIDTVSSNNQAKKTK